MEVNIAKQIIDQRVIKIIDEHPEFFSDYDETRRLSYAFLLLGVSKYLDIDLEEAYSCITDGGNDGGIDAAYIEEISDGQIDVVLFQSKYSLKDLQREANFPANAVEKAINTVKTVFDPYAATILNDRCREIIDEIRSYILDGYIPYVTFVMLNNGNSWNEEGQNYINNAFADNEYVRFIHYGYEEILGAIERIKPINTTLTLSGKAFQENFNFKSVIIGKTNISEIERLMGEYGDKLLEKNVRRYLGKNSVNDNIAETLISDNKSNFFFYNNGITMVCDKLSYTGLQERNWQVRLEGLQIVNGGQTCKTIYHTLKNSSIDTQDVYVLVRIYEISEDETVLNKITYATNHQNPVDLRDLKSNEELQINLETDAKGLGYVYKRKKDINSNNGSIPSQVAAEAIFSIWKQCPHLAKYKKRELFDMYYKDVFENVSASQMIIAVLIFRYCDAARKRSHNSEDVGIARRFGNYFIACMVGQKLLNEMQLTVDEITNRNFESVKTYFEVNKKELEEWAAGRLVEILYDYFEINEEGNLSDVDGRTMAAAFRRFDIVERYIKTSRKK